MSEQLKPTPAKSGAVFAQLDEGDPRRLAAQRRLVYVRCVLAASPHHWNAVELKPLIAATAAQLCEVRPPSWSAVRRWARAYEAAGRDIAALLPSYAGRGNRKAKASGKPLERYEETDYEKAQTVAALLEQAIRTHYLQPQRVTVRAVYEKLETQIRKENQCRAPHDQLPLPHISSLYRRIAALDPYERTLARYGRKQALAQYHVNANTPAAALATHPLARVECDHTRLDLLVVDEQSRLPLGRPWLTALLDVATRMVTGIQLSFAAPGYTSVMQALRHAIRPKDYVRERYPKLQHDWPAHGVPETLVVDNGKEFHSRHFNDCCAQLGIAVDYAPPQCGWYKGSMERWFGTQNTKLLHELPGTTFSNVTQRGAYDPQRHAVISLPALLELIHLWIVDLYQQQVQRGLGAIPYQGWQNGIVKHPPRACARLAELDILTGCHAERRIGRAGLELFALHYHDAALAHIRRALLPGVKAQLKYDPTDLSVIHVYDPTTQRYVAAAAVERDYARGLTLQQHEIIRRHAREKAQAPLDAASLIEAREQITAIINRERAAAPTLTRRTRAARFLSSGPTQIEEDEVTLAAKLAAPAVAPLPPVLASVPAHEIDHESEFVPETAGWSVSYDLSLWPLWKEETVCQ
jgi:putative transposase